MSGFTINSELLLGKSSELDAVFLPVNVDSHSSSSQHAVDLGPPSWDRNAPHNNHYNHYQQYHQQHHHHHGNGSVHHPVGVALDKDGHLVASLSTTPAKETHVLVDDEDDEEHTSGRSKLVKAIITNTPDSNDWCYRATLISMAIIAVIIMLLVFGYDYIQQLLLWLEGVDTSVSIFILMILFCLISFPMAWGLSLLMVVSGYLYGIYSPLIVTLNLTVCLAVSMPIMRGMCSSYLRSRFYSRKVEAIVNVVSGPHGMKVIALTRLTPIPFGLQNALFSLSSISLLRYLISSVGGFVPMTLLNCYMGSTLRSMQDLLSDGSNRMTGYFIFGGQILLTTILLWYVVRKARVELKKAMEESESEIASTMLPNGDCSKTVYVNDSS